MLRQLPLPPSPPSPLPLSYAICWLNHRIAKIVFRSLCLYLARSQLSYVDARVFAAHTHIFYMEKQLSVSTSSEKRRQITQSMGFNSFDSAMISSVFQWCTNKLAKWFMLHTATICVSTYKRALFIAYTRTVNSKLIIQAAFYVVCTHLNKVCTPCSGFEMQSTNR